MSTVQTAAIPEAPDAQEAPTAQEAAAKFMESRTYRALRSACMGEIHARRHYLQAARRMEEAHLHVVAHAFHFTAAQEKEHADIFRGLIAAHGGCCIPMAEDAPLLLPHEPLEILKAAAQSEHDEWDTLYPFNARIAQEEGYPRISAAFLRIAETEQSHAQRFLQYAKAMAEGSLFRDKRRVSWLCLPCGQLHSGLEAPECCSACGRDQGHFIRSSYHPFVVKEG